MKKKRSTEVTNLFQSYRTTQKLQATTQRVWFAEKDNHRKKGKLCVGHTKCYTKVTVPFEEELLGTCALMEITDCFRWHVEGVILERNLEPLSVDEKYFDEARELLARKKQNYQKKPKKMTDKTKEKLKELVDLEEESEDESESESGQSNSEESHKKPTQESPKASPTGTNSNQSKPNDSEDGNIEKSPFALQLRMYQRVNEMVKSLSVVEKVALACFFLGALFHIFGL